jgi:hypothetical protein
MLGDGLDEHVLVAVGSDRGGEEDAEQLRAVGVGSDVDKDGQTSTVDVSIDTSALDLLCGLTKAANSLLGGGLDDGLDEVAHSTASDFAAPQRLLKDFGSKAVEGDDGTQLEDAGAEGKGVALHETVEGGGSVRLSVSAYEH